MPQLCWNWNLTWVDLIGWLIFGHLSCQPFSGSFIEKIIANNLNLKDPPFTKKLIVSLKLRCSQKKFLVRLRPINGVTVSLKCAYKQSKIILAAQWCFFKLDDFLTTQRSTFIDQCKRSIEASEAKTVTPKHFLPDQVGWCFRVRCFPVKPNRKKMYRFAAIAIVLAACGRLPINFMLCLDSIISLSSNCSRRSWLSKGPD